MNTSRLHNRAVGYMKFVLSGHLRLWALSKSTLYCSTGSSFTAYSLVHKHNNIQIYYRYISIKSSSYILPFTVKKTFILSTLLALSNAALAQGQRTYLDQTTIDRAVKPGNDFYAYANGSWLKANEIPATEASWGNGVILRNQTRLRLQRQPPPRKTSPAATRKSSRISTTAA